MSQSKASKVSLVPWAEGNGLCPFVAEEGQRQAGRWRPLGRVASASKMLTVVLPVRRPVGAALLPAPWNPGQLQTQKLRGGAVREESEGQRTPPFLS